jgi:hypothetical protein
MLPMCRKITIPHPNRQKIKLQTKNSTAHTNKHVAHQDNSHPKKEQTQLDLPAKKTAKFPSFFNKYRATNFAPNGLY